MLESHNSSLYERCLVFIPLKLTQYSAHYQDLRGEEWAVLAAKVIAYLYHVNQITYFTKNVFPVIGLPLCVPRSEVLQQPGIQCQFDVGMFDAQ